MKDIYGRPIYRLERVRGSRARYQNSETGQWTPWVWPEASEIGFPDKLNETAMAALLYAYAVRQGFKAVKKGMQAFSLVLQDVGKAMKLEHPEVLTAALNDAMNRHPAGTKLPRHLTVVEDDDHPDFEDMVPFRELSEEQKQRRMDADEARYKHFKEKEGQGVVVELALPKSAQRTLQQIQMEEHLSKLRVAELREWMGDVIDGRLQDEPDAIPVAWKKMKKADIISWLVDNCDPWEVGIDII